MATTEMKIEQEKVQRTLTGSVTSDAMNKTVTVKIERRIKHPCLRQVHYSFYKIARTR